MKINDTRVHETRPPCAGESVSAATVKVAAASLVSAIPELDPPIAINPIGIKQPVPTQSWNGIDEYVLENGLRVVIFPNHAQSFKANLIINAGSYADPPNKKGIAHLTEHLVSGAQLCEDENRRSNIIDIVRTLGGYFDIETGYRHTAYEIEVLNEYVDCVLDIYRKILGGLTLEKDLFLKERETVLNEMQDTNFREEASLMHLRELMFDAGHPSHYGVFGTQDHLMQMSLGDVQDFYSTKCAPQNSVLLIGCPASKKSEVLAKVSSQIGTIPSREYLSRPDLSVKKQTKIQQSIVRDSHQTGVALGYHIPGAGHPDNDTLNSVCSILQNELSQNYASRLSKRVAKLIEHIYVMCEEDNSNGQLSIHVDVSDEAKIKDLESIRDWLLAEMRQIADSGKIVGHEGKYKRMCGNDLAQIKYGIQGAYSYFREKEQEQVKWHDYKHLIADKNIPRRDVKRVIAAYCQPHMSNAVVFKKQDSRTPDTEIDVADIARNIDVEPCNLTVPAYVKQFVKRSDSLLSQLPTIIVTPQSGNSILRRIPIEKSKLIRFRLSIPGGERLDPPGKFGLAQLTKRLLVEAGIKGIVRDRWEGALDAISSRLSYFISNEDHGLYGFVPEEHSQAFLDLLRKFLQDSRLLSGKAHKKLKNLFEQVKSEMINEIRNSSNRELGKYVRDIYLGRVYPEGHPDHVPTVKDRIKQIKNIALEDVIDFYQSHYRLDNAVMTANASDDQMSFIHDCITEFQKWNRSYTVSSSATVSPRSQSGVLPSTSNLQVPDIEPGFVAYANTWSCEDLDQLDLNIRKTMIDSIVYYRLMNAFRDRSGFLYDVDSGFNGNNHLNSKHGDFFISIQAKPELRDVLGKLLKKTLEEIVTNGITEEELALFKTRIFSRLKLDMGRPALISDHDLENNPNAVEDDIDDIKPGQEYPYTIPGFNLDLQAWQRYLVSLDLNSINATLRQMIKPKQFTTIIGT